MLGNHFAVHVGQKIRAIHTIARSGQQIDAAKRRAAFAHHTLLHGHTAGVEVDAEPPRRQAAAGAHADHAKLTLDKGHVDHFGKVVHLSAEQLPEPGGHHAITVVKVQFGRLMHDFFERHVLLAQIEHGLLARGGRARFQGQLGVFFQGFGKAGCNFFGHLFNLGFAAFFGVGLVIGRRLVLRQNAYGQGQAHQYRDEKGVQGHV